MVFPISGITANPLLLAAIGFIVGVLGGFFGVGGGFLTGPMLFLSGVPMNYVVGTDLAHMMGNSLVATRRHRVLGHVDMKLGLLMIIGTVFGVETGARIIEHLQSAGNIDQVIGSIYIVILLIISAFVAVESLRAMQLQRDDELSAGEALAFPSLKVYMSRIRIPPLVSLPISGVEEISLWVVLGVGFMTGLLSGMLGVGGGFIRMPALVYILGIPTHIAIGTDLFEIIFSAGYGTFTHALKGNVDIMIALVMQTGAVMGAQIGSSLTRYVAGPKIRLIFSTLPLTGALLVLYRLLGA
ncbi:MAG: sulfite exporter TauE/SafE family protein [Chloroflexi bacterium]|nr:sulfite exporter TauE/SafE family protein [Chloroflexota bacterium]